LVKKGAWLDMKLMNWNVLSEKEIEVINEASLDTLENTES